MNDKKEIEWINVAKTLCIAIIFLNHSEFYCNCNIGVIRNLYLPFFVNTFFFLSGYLLLKKQLSPFYINASLKEWWNMPEGGRTLLQNILFRIVLPTVIFAVILYIPKIIIRGGNLLLKDMVRETIVDGTYWFTCALAISEVLFLCALLFRIKKIWFYLCFSVILALVAQILVWHKIYFFNDDSMPWYYKSGFTACVFLVIGGIYNKYETLIDNYFKPIICLILIVPCTYILLFHFSSIQCVISRGALDIPGFFVDIVLIYVFIRISKVLRGGKLFNYIGRHSIGFYFFCGAIPNAVWVVMNRAGFNPSLTTTLVCTVLSILLSYPIVFLLNRYVPFVYDLRKFKMMRSTE